jgi:hypothetical protein
MSLGSLSRWRLRPCIPSQYGGELSQGLHEERIVTRSHVDPHPKRLKLGGSNWAYGRDHGAFKALPQLDFPTEGACDIAKPSNLGRACEGDRVDLASSHFGNDSDHARIVNFRSIDIWEHGIRFCPGAFEEFQKAPIRIAGI